MDRLGKIVVFLCAVGIALNFYIMSKVPPRDPAASVVKEAGSDAKAAAATAPDATTGAAKGEVMTPAPATGAVAVPEQTHELRQGSVIWKFSSKGGGVSKAILAAGDQVTLNEFGKEPVGALRREAAGNDPVAYQITQKNERSVTFEGKSAEGVLVRKRFELTTGERTDDHLIKLTVTLTNQGPTAHQSEEYYLYAGAANKLDPAETITPSYFWNDAGDADSKDVGHFSGGMFSSAKSEVRSGHEKLRFGGVLSRFYVTILSQEAKPDKPGKIWASRFLMDHTQDQYTGKSGADSDYAIQAAVGLPPVKLEPGASQTEVYTLYMGPKEYVRLAKLEGQREFVMFYGMFSFISRWLNRLMRWMHELSGNWGIAIILMTIIIRTLLWPLQAKAQYSMKRMGKLAPLMKELQEKYKDNPQQQQMEVMKLYKDYGVNPVSGCFPMLLQIPIFFAFFGVLQHAAELRGQAWLWVKDLSVADTIAQIAGFDINPLPIIMGITMVLQMRLTPQPATMDKAQKMVMNFMPLIFLVFCYNFSAGLALYWTITNIYAIAQSWIMKLYMPEPELTKVEHIAKGPAPQNPFFNPMNPQHKEKKTKPKSPKLGG